MVSKSQIARKWRTYNLPPPPKNSVEMLDFSYIQFTHKQFIHPNMGPYLFSPGRKEVMGRLLSWQACPGCQFALQAEQNSRAQTAHWTSCGSAGESASLSWHTAWQVEEGHHVRQGSSSTSVGTE